MIAMTLHDSTGYGFADGVVRNIVARFESIYPGRITGYYVEGSYADHTAVTTSDLDVTIVFVSPLTASEQERAGHIMTDRKQMSVLELDVTLTDEQQLQQHADPIFKLEARLLYGHDVRDAIPLISITAWARQRMHAAYGLMINVFQQRQPVRAPLTFPQPNVPFYGYTARTMRLLDGSEILTTRNLIRVTGWIATARIAYESQQYVIRKRDCVPCYRQIINDEWTARLEQIDRRCRAAWQHCVPDTESEQAELRAILERTLAFENHFLNLYRQFLVKELMSVEPVAQCAALQALEHTLYVDATVMPALQHLARSHDPEIHLAARQLVTTFSVAILQQEGRVYV